ncbi:MAG TPA: hypothetical protein VGO93_12380 [Candidatus Xenobia bacterium]|jgi:hypothetical protein
MASNRGAFLGLAATVIMPIAAAAGPPVRHILVENKPVIKVGGAHPQVHVRGSIHHVRALQQTTSLSDGFSNLNFGKWRAGMPGVCPSGGTMSIVVNQNGSYTFSGRFPSQASMPNCRVDLAIGVRNSSGKTVAWAESGTVTSLGWSFSRSGTNAQLATMWPALLKGHDFTGSWSAHQIPRANHQASNNTSSGPNVADVLSTVSDVLGVVSLFL